MEDTLTIRLLLLMYPDIVKDSNGERKVELAGAVYSYRKNEDDAYDCWITSNKDRYKTFELE